jgi:thermitase
MSHGLIERSMALVRATFSTVGQRARAARTPGAVFAGLALAVAVVLIMPGLSAHAQEGADDGAKKDYAFLDGDPGEQSLAVGALTEADLDEDPEGNPYVAGELLVAYKQDTPQATANEVDGEVGAKVLDRFSNLDSRLVHFPEIKDEESREAREKALELKKQELEGDPSVKAVGYNYVREAGQAEPGATSNDPFFASQWGLTRISAPQAWDTATGQGAVIAVLDTGIAPTHPDVGSKVDFSEGFCSATDTSANDQNGHGTHVAGIAAANTDNFTGISGAAPDARLQVGKVLCGPEGFATDGSIQAGIDWAIEEPAADVINMSIQGCAYNAAQEAAVNRAWNSGTVVVAIAGNWAESAPMGCSGPNPVVYPGAYDNAMSVAAVNIQNTRSNFSGFRSYVDVAAPGGSTAAGSTLAQQILSTYPAGFQNNHATDGYQWLQGTSMAAPHVAGVAGLLASQGLSASEIRQRIESTTVDLGPVGRDSAFGHGLIDAEAAVTNTPPADTVRPSGSVLINNGAFKTRRLAVSLVLDATDPLPGTGVQHVRASNDGIRWSSWVAFSPGTYDWTLAGKRAGTKKVYVQYRDGAGNVSNTATDTIRYAPRR